MTATIHRLPTAAAEPVVNVRKRGRYAKAGNVIAPYELLHRRYKRGEERRLAEVALGVGKRVRVNSPLSANHGRVGVIIAAARPGWWVVEAADASYWWSHDGSESTTRSFSDDCLVCITAAAVQARQ